MADQFWLSDLQWAVIEPLLPCLGGKLRVDDRRVISGILHRYQASPDFAMVDSSAVRAHRSAAGAKGGSKTKPSAVRAADLRPKSTRSRTEPAAFMP